MLLTVLVPDNQPGMERMLQKELNGVESEVIKKPWAEALREATGDFVCFLEKDSAISNGSIKRNLEEFINNRLYRKLAMVTSQVDFPHLKTPILFTYNTGGLAALEKPTSQSLHSTRIGYLPGAIIRRSSLNKINLPYNASPMLISAMVSLFFWENGLRIALQPGSLYYAPEKTSYEKLTRPYPHTVEPSDKLMRMWISEMIA